MWLLTSNDVHSWQEVTDILYPNWKVVQKSEHGLSYLTLPADENDVVICENSPKLIEIDLFSIKLVPMPSDACLHKWQPTSWIWSAISQDQPNVLEFMLRHDLILPSVYAAKDSLLAEELCASGRDQYVALYLLYEPIDFDVKFNMILSAHRSKKISIIPVSLWFIRYIINRKMSGRCIYPEYMKPDYREPGFRFFRQRASSQSAMLMTQVIGSKTFSCFKTFSNLLISM